MATENKKEEKVENNKGNRFMPGVKSAAWLLETVARGLAGYVILTNFSNVFVIGVGIYFTGTAAVLLITHFVKAYAK